MRPTGGVVDHADQIQLRPALFQPRVLAGVPLHQLPTPGPSGAPRVDFRLSLFPRLPQLGFDHPRPHRFAADCDLMVLAQVLAGQCGSEPAILRLSQNRHLFGLALLVHLAVGSFSPPTVDRRLIAFAVQLHQQTPDVPFCLPNFFRRLTLCDESLLGFLQSVQPIAFLSRHEKCSCFHLPSLILSIGHF